MLTPKRGYSYPFSNFVFLEHTLSHSVFLCTVGSSFSWFILSALFASVLTHCWLPINDIQQMHPDFSLQLSSPLVAIWTSSKKILLVNPSVRDLVLGSIKFHFTFITSVLKVIQFFQYGILVFLYIDNVSNFVRSTNLFKMLLHFVPGLLMKALNKVCAWRIQ